MPLVNLDDETYNFFKNVAGSGPIEEKIARTLSVIQKMEFDITRLLESNRSMLSVIKQNNMIIEQLTGKPVIMEEIKM